MPAVCICRCPVVQPASTAWQAQQSLQHAHFHSNEQAVASQVAWAGAQLLQRDELWEAAAQFSHCMLKAVCVVHRLLPCLVAEREGDSGADWLTGLLWKYVHCRRAWGWGWGAGRQTAHQTTRGCTHRQARASQDWIHRNSDAELCVSTH